MSALPDLVGVVGGGRIGAGIAHAFLAAGCDVTVREVEATSAEAAAARVEKSIGVAIACALEVTSLTQGRPRAVNDRQNANQPAPSSAVDTSMPRIFPGALRRLPRPRSGRAR